MRSTAFVVVLALVFGCRPEPRQSIAIQRIDSLTASIAAVQRRMHERFVAARQIEEAIAMGDLDGARASARVITLLDEPEALPAWRPYIDDVQLMASQVELAATVADAARSATILGLRCAHCHVAIKAGVTFPAEPQPLGNGQRAQMAHHQWAAVQMWQGVIAPSQERWLAGAAALTRFPIDNVTRPGIPSLADDIDDVARMRDAGRRALAASSDDVRIDVFGEVLVTCAHCHAAWRNR